MRITLATEGGIEAVECDGLNLEEMLEAKLGDVPDASQVRVDNAQVLGDLSAVTLREGQIIQVFSEAVASKGIPGA